MTPCENCIVIPICRHKSYFHLMEDCRKIHRYVYSQSSNGKEFKRKLWGLSYKLNPTDWQPYQIFRGSQRLGGIATK